MSRTLDGPWTVGSRLPGTWVGTLSAPCRVCESTYAATVRRLENIPGLRSPGPKEEIFAPPGSGFVFLHRQSPGLFQWDHRGLGISRYPLTVTVWILTSRHSLLALTQYCNIAVSRVDIDEAFLLALLQNTRVLQVRVFVQPSITLGAFTACHGVFAAGSDRGEGPFGGSGSACHPLCGVRWPERARGPPEILNVIGGKCGGAVDSTSFSQSSLVHELGVNSIGQKMRDESRLSRSFEWRSFEWRRSQRQRGRGRHVRGSRCDFSCPAGRAAGTTLHIDLLGH